MPPFLEIPCLNCLDIQNPRRKVIKKVVSDLNFCAQQWCKIAAVKIGFLLVFLLSSHLFTPFNGLFATTCQSPMSKLFTYLESLGKSHGENLSQICTVLLKNEVKSPPQKKVTPFKDL